jgi:hypothetical protein
LKNAAKSHSVKKISSRKFTEWLDYVDLYRVGNYEDAEEPVKASWVYFCSHIVGHINSQWKSMLSGSVFQNLLLNRIATASDEAYALFICNQKFKEWIRTKWNEIKEKFKSQGAIDKPGIGIEEATKRAKEMVEDDASEEEEQDNNDTAAESKIDGEMYFKLVKQVQEKRATIQGSTWDLGFKITMSNPPASRRSTASVDSSVSSKQSSQSKKTTDQKQTVELHIEDW